MSPNYDIAKQEPKIDRQTALDRLERIARLSTRSHTTRNRKPGRNALTRTVDAVFGFIRKYLPPIHWLFVALGASVLFVYARLVAVTARLITTDDKGWPHVPSPCVLALWHSDAPSLVVSFAKQRLRVRTVIMVANDPRGDYLALLCGMVGFGVVRGDSEEGGWEALEQLANELINGACVVLTADGGGPARVAKVGAVALASSVSVPLVPLRADCHPAIQERHKWDAARNPLPFCTLTVSFGPSKRFDVLKDVGAVEAARAWLEKRLNSF